MTDPIVRGPERHTIGKYSIVRQLGAGGMAHVYLCERQGIGGFRKQVVAKVIRPEKAHDRDVYLMFLDEARLSAELSHPHVVQVFEVDTIDGQPYLVMEYVHGPSLWRLIRQAEAKGDTPHGHIASLLAQVARGLHYAHFRDGPATGAPRLVHRDVSLQNILVAADGTAKLIDFGIAQAAGRLYSTAMGVKGKLQYMSPEQFYGGAVDQRADIFGLGVSLFRATASCFPFGGTGLDAAPAASRGEDPAKRLPERYPRELVPILRRALAAEPQDRYPTCAALADDLEQFCALPGRASSPAAIAAWIAEEFPYGAEDWLDPQDPRHVPSIGTSDPNWTSSSTAPTSSIVPAPPVPARRSSRLVPFLAGAATVLVATWAAWALWPAPPAPPPPVEPAPATAVATPEPAAAPARPAPRPRPAPRASDPFSEASPEAEGAAEAEIAEIAAAPEEAPPAPVEAAPAPPVEAAPAAEPAPPPAPAPAGPRPLDERVGDALPEAYLIRSPAQIARVLSAIEEHAINAGVAPDLARGSTRAVSAYLVESYNPGTGTEIAPREIFRRILAAARAGRGRAALEAELQAAAARGELR